MIQKREQDQQALENIGFLDRKLDTQADITVMNFLLLCGFHRQHTPVALKWCHIERQPRQQMKCRLLH